MQKLEFERLFLNLRISTKEQIYANKKNKFVQTDGGSMEATEIQVDKGSVFGVPPHNRP
nr:hypothetical protein [uncultured Undibacterium sp.]